VFNVIAGKRSGVPTFRAVVKSKVPAAIDVWMYANSSAVGSMSLNVAAELLVFAIVEPPE